MHAALAGPRIAAIATVAAALAGLAAGCFAPESIVCSDGRICPAGSRCDTVNHLCLSPTQASSVACEGRAEEADCSLSGAPGKCRVGICQLLHCGDQVRSGTESCDGADLGGKTCLDLGFYRAPGLACTGDCTFDTSACGGTCGDGTIEETEVCDGTNLGSASCLTAGFYDAAGLTCSSSCTFDTSACTGRCGDHIKNGPEACDGVPPSGETCLDYGFDRGLLGCSGLCGPGFEGCGQIGWETVALSFTRQAAGVWGSAPDDVYAVGGSTIQHWNGAAWSATTPDSTVLSAAMGVWGSGPDDVFVVGLAADRTGVVLHWDGERWSTSFNRPLAGGSTGLGGLYAVWGSGPNDVYAAGEHFNTLIHWDGATWSPVMSETTRVIYAVWGSGPDDVYAVGGRGTEPIQHVASTTGSVLHWNGTSWSEIFTVPGQLFRGVWGSSAGDVFVTGYSGTVMRWDGVRWSTMETGLTDDLQGLWGTSSEDVFAVGSTGTIAQWDGRRWSRLSSGTTQALVAVGGIADDVYAAGGTAGPIVLHWNRTSWNLLGTNMLEESLPALVGAWASGSNELFAATDTRILHWDVTGWTDMIVPALTTTGAAIAGLWGSSSTDLYAVGPLGTLLRSTGGPWSKVSAFPISSRAVWGSGPSDVFAVGDYLPSSGGPSSIVHWDGVRWTLQPSPKDSPPLYLKGVWGSGPNDVFAVGSATPTGANPVIVHWDGTLWSKAWFGGGTVQGLLGVWGSGPNDVFAVGVSGGMVHWDGSTWSVLSSGTAQTLWTVGGSGPGDVFAAGDNVLLHLRGAVWEPIALPVKGTVRSLVVTPSRIFLAGTMGAVALDRGSVTCVGPERGCGDGWDNDCDGVADGADPDCAGLAVELCANLVDDDGDGAVDCADPGCAAFPACKVK